MNRKRIPNIIDYLEKIYLRTKSCLVSPISKKYMPLKIAMKASGYIEIELSKKINNMNLGFISNDCLYIGNNLSGDKLNTLISNISSFLKNYIEYKRWSNELLDILNNEETIGYIERTAARILGLRTRAVHLNAWDKNYLLWVSRRSSQKDVNPGKLDSLVGGLVSYGETPEQALERESLEEAGIDIKKIEKRSKLTKMISIIKLTDHGYQIEDLFSSSCIIEEEISPSNQDGEIECIKKYDLKNIIKNVSENKFTEESSFIVINNLLHLIKRGTINYY